MRDEATEAFALVASNLCCLFTWLPIEDTTAPNRLLKRLRGTRTDLVTSLSAAEVTTDEAKSMNNDKMMMAGGRLAVRT